MLGKFTTLLAKTLRVILAIAFVTMVATRPALAQRSRVGDTEIWLINYQAQAKDPTAATILSIFPGFGAGHFYSNSTKTGLVSAGGQLLGLGLFLLGAAIAESGDNSRTALQAVGGAFFLAFKIGEVAYAPFAAENYNKNLVMHLGIPFKGGAMDYEQNYSKNNKPTRPQHYETKPKPQLRPEPEPAVEPEGFQY